MPDKMRVQQSLPTHMTFNFKTLSFAVLGIIIFFIILAAWPFTIIRAGYRGVVFNNISGVENRILGEGTHLRIPFVESIMALPIQTQASVFDENAGSADSQSIQVKVTVNWRLDPSRVNRIYQNIGDEEAVVARVLNNNTQDAVKAAVSKYAALDFQKNRENVRAIALKILQDKVKTYDVLVDNISFTDIQFSPEFNTAIEQAQVAQQKAKQAEYDVQRVQNEAKSAIAKAEGEAEAQKQVQQSLTAELLQKMAIEKWDGKLPINMYGDAVPFVNIR